MDLYTRRTVHMLNKVEDGAANRRKRGRPQKRSMAVVKEDMQTVGVPEKNGKDRVKGRQMTCCGDRSKACTCYAHCEQSFNL